jgi:pyruvate dehydrogenase E1 component alpha subunit
MTTATGDQTDVRLSDALSKDDKVGLLKQLLDIRRFEEKCAQSYQQAKIGGFCHIYIGQEAVAVGQIAAAKATDPVITAYRDHAHALARGMDPRYCMAEMYGKITGCAKGKGGSMHMFDKPNHMYGGHAIVGGQAPLGTGLAFAAQYNHEDTVTLCSFGDGALNQGAVHEAMNLASIWNLPILFILENNSFSMGTAIERGTAAANNLGAKADAYDMRYAECNGMDVLDVYECFSREISLTRGSTSAALGREQKGSGPCFINVKTDRYQGHSMSDPQKYRDKKIYDAMKKDGSIDPILRLVEHLIDNGLATQEEIDALDKQAKASAAEAIKYANESPDTPIEEMYTDVYINPFPPYIKGDLPQILKDAE